MKNGLKPCPFCGGTDLVISACEEFVAIVCDFRQNGCGASGGYRDTEEKAVEAWNRREKMKREDFWWVDENNNKWDADLYTEDEAEKYRRSLTNCDNCINCRNCVNCDSCIRCDSCINCDNCINCDSCNGYTANPSMYITQNIGSRNDQTIFYYGKTKEDSMSIQVKCGCFHGNLKEFAEAVEKTHGDNKYGEQYRKEIKKVKMLFELEDEYEKLGEV